MSASAFNDIGNVYDLLTIAHATRLCGPNHIYFTLPVKCQDKKKAHACLTIHGAFPHTHIHKAALHRCTGMTHLCHLQVKLHRTDAVQEHDLPKALSQAISTAFDLSTGPLIHLTLIPLTSKEDHVLVANMHYAVADGWSLGVLFKDISRAYNSLKHSKGETSA